MEKFGKDRHQSHNLIWYNYITCDLSRNLLRK